MTPIARCFSGQYSFPGIYAFINTPARPEPVLLQFDQPFTGNFNDLEARNTCGTLQGMFHEGDQATVTGLIRDSDVNGINRPVLFLFN